MANLEKGFLILYEWLPAINDLPPKELKNLLLSLIYLQKDGTELPCFTNKKTDVYAQMMEPVIRRRLVGKNNSTPKAYPEAYPKAKRREEKRREDKEKIRESEELSSRVPRTPKTPYGEFSNVYLTEDEWNALADKYGKSVAEGLVDNFSRKIKAKGYQYDDHYASILDWANKDGVKPRSEKSYDVDDFFYAALERSYAELEKLKGEENV